MASKLNHEDLFWEVWRFFCENLDWQKFPAIWYNDLTVLKHFSAPEEVYTAHSGAYQYNVMYCSLAKEGPWAVHLTLGSNGGHLQ